MSQKLGAATFQWERDSEVQQDATNIMEEKDIFCGSQLPQGPTGWWTATSGLPLPFPIPVLIS